MSDPNMDAADNYCNLQALAFDDFMRWCDVHEDDEYQDIERMTERYARDCESGEWKMHTKEPKA